MQTITAKNSFETPITFIRKKYENSSKVGHMVALTMKNITRKYISRIVMALPIA